MATLELSLPDDIRNWISQQVKTGLYIDESDVVRDVIRQAQIADNPRRYSTANPGTATL